MKPERRDWLSTPVLNPALRRYTQGGSGPVVGTRAGGKGSPMGSLTGTPTRGHALAHAWASAEGTHTKQRSSTAEQGGRDGSGGGGDQWISGLVVEGAPTEEPRPDASNARSQRLATRRATGVSRAFACVLNTRGFPQVFCTAPVIHPVRVHKYPWQAS
jgi:hypothetical protein